MDETSIEVGPQGFPTSYMVEDIAITPNVVLAPMEGVTDVVFRRMIRRLGGPGLTYSEFIASKNLTMGERKAERMAQFDPDERPVALQIYGNDPSYMAEAAKMLEDRGATILDINMGCPSKAVCKNSGGSALMKDPELAVEIVRAVKAAISIPLTVKMRAGFDRDRVNAPELCEAFEAEGVAALTIHWRTREERYGGVRDVSAIAEAKRRVSIPVIANGDVVDVESARAMFEETGCDGVMVGRGAIVNPWVFQQIHAWLRGEPIPEPSLDDRERLLFEFYDMITEALPERAIIGRMKMVTKHVAQAVDPTGEILRRPVLRSQSTQQARDLARAAFDTLRDIERGIVRAS